MGATMDRIKGKLKKAEGKVTDDELREAQGYAQDKKGKAKGAIKRGVKRAKARVNEARVRSRTTKGKAKRKASAARRMP